METSEFYDSVYMHDQPVGRAHGFIQWKGTDVCIDLRCECGYHGHYDGLSLYFYRCPACLAGYALGQIVAMIRLNEDQVEYVEAQSKFETCSDFAVDNGDSREAERAGVEREARNEIDRLRQHLRDEGDRVAELRDALHSLVTVARRYLPDYDEHPEIQKADAVLMPNI